MKAKKSISVNFTIRTINSDGSFYLLVDYDDFECITTINYPLFSRGFQPRDGWSLDAEIEKIVEEIGRFYDHVESLVGFDEIRYLE